MGEVWPRHFGPQALVTQVEYQLLDVNKTVIKIAFFMHMHIHHNRAMGLLLVTHPPVIAVFAGALVGEFHCFHADTGRHTPFSYNAVDGVGFYMQKYTQGHPARQLRTVL